MALTTAWVSAQDVEVRPVQVDTQIMRFPAISVDGIGYDALSFEYAVRGRVTISEIHTASESLTCEGQVRQNHYLVIDYKGPEVLFRILDRRADRILLLQPVETSGSETYGQGDCAGAVGRAERFERQRAAWLDELNGRLLSQARLYMETFVEQDAALTYEDLSFPMFYLRAEGRNQDPVNEAVDRALDAFDLYTRFGVTLEAQTALKSAAHTWEQALDAMAKRRGPWPAEDALRQALHRNLSATYLFLQNFEQARRHDALALSRGMAERESLQSTILLHERRTMLSPQVAANLVQMLNLFRFGRNAISDARLEEVDTFAEWRQQLGQNKALRR